MAEDYLVLYVAVRNDLPSMNPGKAAAHSGHAASLAARDLRDYNEYEEWCGTLGFGTQINVEIPFDHWEQLVVDARRLGGYGGIVVDPTYPIRVSSELNRFFKKHVTVVEGSGGYSTILVEETTAIYIFGWKSKLEPLMGEYRLAP